MEGSPGNRDWGRRRCQMSSSNGAGLNVLASHRQSAGLGRGPGNYRPQRRRPAGRPATPTPTLWASWQAHNCGKVQAIEVWNEQNLWYEWGHAAPECGRYVDLLGRRLSRDQGRLTRKCRHQRRLDPHRRPPAAAIDDFTYLEQMYAGRFEELPRRHRRASQRIQRPAGCGGQAACDFIRGRVELHAVQQSASLVELPGDHGALPRIMAKYGDAGKRVWPTEFGWASGWIGKPGYEYANENTAAGTGRLHRACLSDDEKVGLGRPGCSCGTWATTRPQHDCGIWTSMAVPLRLHWAACPSNFVDIRCGVFSERVAP